MSALQDEPIVYDLTETGWAAVRTTMTTEEAAALHGVDRDVISAAARAGVLRGVKVARTWVLDRQSVLDFNPTLLVRRTRLPAAPLLRLIELHGGDYELGVRIGSADKRALERARHDGWVTLATGDRLVVRLLGLTPWEVWGPAYG
jgi:excisionase family DNA binding protein